MKGSYIIAFGLYKKRADCRKQSNSLKPKVFINSTGSIIKKHYAPNGTPHWYG